MIETEVATFEQITALLSHLMTNYSTMAITYYDMFYNTVPKDIVIKLYDNDGNLKQYTIPNRAKDFRFTLNGTGSPEGVVSADIGTTYQDTLNGKLYIKESASGDVMGWVLVGSDEFIKNGEGSPENVLVAPKGTLYIDKANSGLYIKGTDTGRTGWSLISANTSNLANKNLDNLSSTGEAHFANPSLGNLNSTGEAHFANPNATNFSNTGKATLSGFGMPSSRYVQLTIGASGSTYTAPANGYLNLSAYTSTNCYFDLTYSNMHVVEFQTSNYGNASGIYPIKSGTTYTLHYDGVERWNEARFVYAEGN